MARIALDTEELGDLAGEHAQLRDDVVFGSRCREERSGDPAGGQVGRRCVDAVPFPGLKYVPLEQKRYFPPGPPLGDFPRRSGRTSAPANAIRREAGRRGRTETVPPDLFLRHGHERSDGDAAGVPGGGRRDGERQNGGNEKGGAERRAPRVDR